MDAKATPSRRADGIDLEQFQNMLVSEPWSWFVDRVRQEMARAQATCETSGDVQELMRAQVAAKALRTVLGLPATLVAEMRPKKG